MEMYGYSFSCESDLQHLAIKTSCMDEAFLMNLIKKKAKTIE